MRSLTRFVAAFVILISFTPTAYAQTVPLLTIASAQQPSNTTALPGQTIPAAAIVVTAGAGSPVSITGIKVSKTGSAADGAVAGLVVNENATTTVGSSGGLSGGDATIPVSLTLAAGETEVLLVSVTTASNLVGYQGQFLALDIIGIQTTAVTQGPLPIYGAQIALSTGVSKPTCSLTASPNVYGVGQTVDLRWSSTNATKGTITSLGNVGGSGLQGILPSGSGTYTGTFTGPGGTGTCSTSVTFNPGLSSGVPGLGNPTGSVPAGGGTCNHGVGNCASGTTINGEPTTAQTGSGVGNVCNGVNCSLCNGASLIQNVINTLVGLTIPLAAAMFAYAGILYFTSAANQHNLERAKSVFKTVLWGFLLVITAWLIVQTLLNAISNKNFFTNGSWNTLACVSTESRPGTTSTNSFNFGTELNSILGIPNLNNNTSAGNGGVAVSPTSSGNSSGGCPSGYTIQDGGYCFNSDTGDIVNPSPNSSGSGSDTGSGGGGSGGSSVIQSIYAQESSSGSDPNANVCNNYGACGPMQIQPSTACNTDPSNVPGCNSNGTVGNLTQVQDYLNNQSGSDSQLLGGQILDKNLNNPPCNGDMSCAVAEYNGGNKAVVSSADCASGYAYQCPYDSLSPSTGKYCNGTTVTDCKVNTGFQETRNYVQSVCSKSSCNI